MLRRLVLIWMVLMLALSGLAEGIESRIPESERPQTSLLTWETAGSASHVCTIEKVNPQSLALCIEMVVETAAPLGEADATALDQWLDATVSAAIQGIAVDAPSLAHVAESAIRSGIGASAWPTAELRQVKVTVPYYPTLSKGVNGSATQRLQVKLIQLGYLSGSADGSYGPMTVEAVAEVKRYAESLEPSTALAAPAASEDGSADPVLQAWLFSSAFPKFHQTVQQGSSGDEVLRVQRRLAGLGYLSGSVDGNCGSGTARAILLFQYYNGLNQTGIADSATQEKLFSADAGRAPSDSLAEGSSEQNVLALQQRLQVLGFMTGQPDGNFGSATASGVRNLQQYMIDANLSALPVAVNGIADPLLLEDFFSSNFPALPGVMQNGSSGPDVTRLQRRLSGLQFYYGSLDGNYGDGTEEAVRTFQRQHGLNVSGIADAATCQMLFSASAQVALKPYLLKVSVDDQRVYVYGLDDNNQYTVPVRMMTCSTGRNSDPTPKGTYTDSTGPGARWHYFTKFDCWAQYAYYIEGDIMFHSVLYAQKDGSVTQSSVRNLGSKASHGCVRLSVEDARWIYVNCPAHTTVIVY